jgi:predicted ATP-grasp superfamily ATP-dependent carboligase
MAKEGSNLCGAADAPSRPTRLASVATSGVARPNGAEHMTLVTGTRSDASHAPFNGSDRHTGRVHAVLLDAVARQALVTARSLGRSGRRVAIAESRAEIPGLFRPPAFASRWCVGSRVLPSFRRDPEAYGTALIDFVKASGAPVVVPATDGSVAAVRAVRDELSEFATVALASETALGIANDKDRTLALASSLGITVPRSALAETWHEVQDGLREVGLPAVIKPCRSWVQQNGIGWRVASHAVVDEREAAACYAELEAAGCPAIVQEWVPGAREAVSLLYADGRAWAEFAQVAHRMTPVLGGVSAVRESIAVPDDLGPAARRLVEAIDLEGYSEIEFRRDGGGRPLLMEINARLSGSVEVAVRAGVDFPRLLWSWAAGEPIDPTIGYRTGLRMRYFGGDLQWLIENMRRQGRPDSTPRIRALAMFMAEFFRRDGYDYVDRHDLKPAVVAAASGMAGAGRRARRKAATSLGRVGAQRRRGKRRGA